jgi:hypothetical protein
MWMGISAVMKKVPSYVAAGSAIPVGGRRTAQRDWTCLSPAISYIIPSSSDMSSQGHSTKSRPGLQSQHVCDGVKYVLNKSQVFPTRTRSTLSIRQLAVPNAPLLGIECFLGEFHCTLKTRSWVPLWPQNHWPPCVPLIKLSSSYCTCRPTNLRLTNTSINHLFDLNCSLVFSTHSLNLALLGRNSPEAISTSSVQFLAHGGYYSGSNISFAERTPPPEPQRT